MFEDKKENRRKHLTNNKKRDSSKRKHKYDDDFTPRKKSPKHDKEDVRAEEIWEEWENRSDY